MSQLNFHSFRSFVLYCIENLFYTVMIFTLGKIWVFPFGTPNAVVFMDGGGRMFWGIGLLFDKQKQFIIEALPLWLSYSSSCHD